MQSPNKGTTSNSKLSVKRLFESIKKKQNDDGTVVGRTGTETADHYSEKNSNLPVANHKESKKVRFEDGFATTFVADNSSSEAIDSKLKFMNKLRQVFNSSHSNITFGDSSISSQCNHFHYTDELNDDVPSSSGARTTKVFTEERYKTFDEDRDLSTQSIKEKNKYYARLQEVTNSILEDDFNTLYQDQDSFESENEQEDDPAADDDQADDDDVDDDVNVDSKIHCSIPLIDLKNIWECPTCYTPIKRTVKKRSDKDIKSAVLSMTLKDIMALRCQTEKGQGCKQNGISTIIIDSGNCIANVRVRALYDNLNNLYNTSEDIIMSKVRGEKLELMLMQLDKENNQLKYKIGDTAVCEIAYVISLGLTKSRNLPSQFRRIRDEVLYPEKKKERMENPARNDKDLRRRRDLRYINRFTHATDYIMWIASLNSDACPTDGDVKILPYDSIQEFYAEYVAQSMADNLNENHYAKRETFRKAFKKLSKSYRLSGSRGSFPTCDMCNNAHDLLRDPNIKNQHDREMLHKFKRTHLLQQMEERRYLEENRNNSRKTRNGQPIQLFILMDGMTASRGNTPQVGAHFKQPKNETAAQIANRVIGKYPCTDFTNLIINDKISDDDDIGVEVVCGEIDQIYYYNIDNLVSGGANLTCQLILEVIKDVSKELAKRRQILPRKCVAQFDNCGENKNKFVFALFSKLIEEFYFDEIHCNFLLVGHTHCSIDQNFGVLTKAINSKRFIGSSLSLHALLKIAHDDVNRRPTVVRQITIIYDFKAYFKPVLNNEIVAIRIPHCFKFSRVLNKCVVQYKLFSPHKWLPEPPENSLIRTEDDISKSILTEIPIPRWSSIGGEDNFYNELKIAKTDTVRENIASHRSNNNQNNDDIQRKLKLMLPYLDEIDRVSVDQQLQRMQFEEEHGSSKTYKKAYFMSSSQSKKNVENMMKATSTAKNGYIIYLKSKYVANDNNDELEDESDPGPKPVISLQDIQALLCSIASNPYELDDDDEDEVIISATESTAQQIKNKKANITAFETGAKIIAKTARSVLAQFDAEGTKLFKIHKNPGFSYDSKKFNFAEIAYFQARNTVEGVLNVYLKCLQEEPAHFEWIDTDLLSDEALLEIEAQKQKLQEDTDKLLRLARTLIIKQGHDKESGEHIITKGLTKPPKLPKKNAISQQNIICAVTECPEKGTEVCKGVLNDAAFENPDGGTLPCMLPGIFFCISHCRNGNHYNHKNGLSLKNEEEFKAAAAAANIAKVQEKRKKNADEKKKKKSDLVNNIKELRKAAESDVQTIASVRSKKQEKADKIRENNREFLNHVNRVVEAENIDNDEGDEIQNETTDDVAIAVNDISNNNADVPVNLSVQPEPNIFISKVLVNNNKISISPISNRKKSRSFEKIPEPKLAIDSNDANFNDFMYRSIKNIFNGKNEPRACFIETLSFRMYNNQLISILYMYKVPIFKVKQVFSEDLQLVFADEDDNIFELSKNTVKSMGEALKDKATRDQFLRYVYEYMITLS